MAGDESSRVAAMFRVLRALRNWNQRQLAEAVGIDPSRISAYERGEVGQPARELLERAAAVARISYAFLEQTVISAERLIASSGDRRAEGSITEAASQAVADHAGPSLAAFAELIAPRAGESEDEHFGAAKVDPVAEEESGSQAAVLWGQLAPLTSRQRRILVEDCREFRNASLWRRLCAESRKAASRSAREALDIATLAVRLSRLLPGSTASLTYREAIGTAFVGNARRVANDLPGADAAFARATAVVAGVGTADRNPADEARRLDLEASLRRNQRRFGEALTLLDRALTLAPAGSLRGWISLNRANAFEQAGDPEKALGALQEATESLNATAEPRLRWVLCFNRIAVRLRLGQAEQAEAELADLQALVTGAGSDLDLLRVRWLEGRVAEARGLAAEALAAFSEVRTAFAIRDLPADAALAALEEAALLLAAGRTGDVRRLVREMGPIFEALGLNGEVLASIRLFVDAVLRDTATAALARAAAEALAQRRPQNEG
jgi:transcriptional regulator with XRE-family HTH domain